jgi:hypothetical protein
MRRFGRFLLVAALLVTVTACDAPESASRPPAGVGTSTQGSAAGPPTAEKRPVSRRLGETYRYNGGAVDATVTVDRFREATPPPGDLIAVAVVVDVRDGAWMFGPDMVRFSYDGQDRGTGTVTSGPVASALLGPGSSTRWALRFAAPAQTDGAKVTVHASATLPLAEWLL